MFDREVTAPDPLPRTTPMSDDELRQYEGLFLLLCRLRAASSDSLWRLFFERVLGMTSRSAAFERIHRLIDSGYLRRRRITEWRSVNHLTQRSLGAFPSVRARGTDWLRRPPGTTEAHRCWLRGALHAELTADGYTVGRGPRELAALRRFYIDRQARLIASINGGAEQREAENALAHLRDDGQLVPPFRARCPNCSTRAALNVAVDTCARCGASFRNEIVARVYRCKACSALSDELGAHVHLGSGSGGDAARAPCHGEMREIDVIAVDIAWRRANDSFEVIALFIDDTRRSLDHQLALIPAQIIGQPRLPIILRSTDMRSRYVTTTRSWLIQGPRHQALLRAFSEHAPEAQFPFSLTTKVIEYRPELELWTIHQGVHR